MRRISAYVLAPKVLLDSKPSRNDQKGFAIVKSIEGHLRLQIGDDMFKPVASA